MLIFVQFHRYNNCTCGDHPCVTPPSDLSYYVLRTQWITLSLRLQQHTEELQDLCIPVLVEQMHHLNRVFTNNFDSKECFTIGCPLLPLLNTSTYSSTDSIWLPSVGEVCEPVVYDNQPYAPEFIQKVTKHRQPMVPYSTPVILDSPLYTLIQCATLPFLYMLGEDRIFHEFPNWRIFVVMGFDTDQVDDTYLL
ncbi:hypothetical protein EON65_09640 [archaeon]|nr:MAG: hypothetical protein EON65_09640 [archaeon]